MNTSAPTSQIDVREILALLWRRKWLLIIPVPLVAALVFAGSYLITPEYSSATIIQIDPQIQLIGDLQRLIGEPSGYNVSRGRDRANLLRSMFNEVTSTQYAELLNQRMGLVQQPGIEQQARLYVQLQPSMSIDRARLLVLQDQLKESVDVGWASGDQIRIRVNSTDAAQARDLANNIGDIFIAEKVRQDLNQIRSSQDFSDVHMERYEHQVREKSGEITRVEQHVARLRTSSVTTSEANRSEIEDEIDQTDNEVRDLRQDERDVLTRLRDVEDLNTGQLTLEDSDEKEAAITEMRSRLGQAGDLLSRYIWSDTRVINFKLRQNELMSTIESENRYLVNDQYARFDQVVRTDLTHLFNTRSRLDYLYTKKPYLQSALADLTPPTDMIPELEAQLVQLRRELQVATDIRDRFRRQQESSSISQALIEDRSSSKYRKVEPAKLALEPFTPNRKKILLMGIMLGIAIGGAAVLLVELLDNSFKKVEDIEATLGLQVIGITPKFDFEKQLGK
jgi:capsular polysaccharide biosynthesis protein